MEDGLASVGAVVQDQSVAGLGDPLLLSHLLGRLEHTTQQLGVVVVGQWSWKNLTTSDKRSALVTRIQSLRQEYLG